jgi:predicted ArsR family transcriptional regulator
MVTPTTRLNTSAGKVLSQLRHGPKTVEELAKALRITGNAIRNQLRKLQADNLVVRTGTRAGISKPSALYAITLEGQIQFSTLYLPVLSKFLQVAEGKCSGIQLESFMTDTGKALASRYSKPSGALRSRANAAARLIKGFGGVTEVRSRDGELQIRSLVCPLAALTAEQPAACNVLEALLGEYIDAAVTSCCDRTEEPKCCFRVGL